MCMMHYQTFYEEYPLPWEVRFAVSLLDAAEGNASSAFWGMSTLSTTVTQSIISLVILFIPYRAS